MTIMYVISVIILIVLAMLIEKSKEKIEFVKTFIIINVLLLAYNCFWCYIFNLINIPITLVSLGIINFIICVLMLLTIIKNKRIQKYNISKMNIIVILILLTLTIIILNVNFEGLTKIRYVSMDAREHYKVAREFLENEFLSNKAVKSDSTSGGFMPMAYTNVGIIFKILNPYIGTVNLYKAYILFEAFMFILVGIVFYMILEKYLKSTKSKILTLIFVIIYVLGYPLNAWIYGFHYLILGILFVEMIIYLCINQDKINLANHIILLFFANFGLIFSYSLFCPFVYFAEFLYFIFNYKQDKDKAKLFIYILIVLSLTGIIGVTYLILPNIGKIGGFIALDGVLYKNLWSNFVLFIPFTIFEIYKNIKDKKISFENILFDLLLIYMLFLFIGTKIGKCSEYYFEKNYFILWLMLSILNVKGMVRLIEGKKEQFIVVAYTIIYLVLFFINVQTKQTYVTNENDDNISNLMEIFTFNNTMINAPDAAFVTRNELKLYESMEKIINGNWEKYKEDEILFITDPTQERWIQSLTGYKNILFDNYAYAVQNLKENNYKYIIISKNRSRYKQMKEYINYNMLELICEIDEGEIYTRNGE